MPISRLQTEVERSVRFARDASPHPALVVGLSGGADSVALLHALHAIGGFRLVAAHLDHGLRPDSPRDAAFCRRLCRALGVPLRVGRADVRGRAQRDGGGIEEAARVERRAFLEAVCAREDASWIVLAHTRDDQAETVLLRLLRGSASAGLGAMRARAGRLLRPMLRLSRREVLDHLSAHGLAWREDPSNTDPVFLRNRVRHELIPYLETRFNPAIREALARTASVLGEEADLLADLAASIAVRAEDGTAIVSREAVRTAPRAVARLAVRGAVRAAGGLRGVSLDHVDAIVALAGRPAASGRRVPLPGGRDASIHFDEIRIGPAVSAGVPFVAALDVPGRAPLPDGRTIVARDGGGRRSRAIGVPEGPLTVRTRRPGDRVRSGGREMSLKRFLMDRRVPAADRDRLPVVAAGQTVVWVDGQPVDGAPGSSRRVRLDVAAHRFTGGNDRKRTEPRSTEVHIDRAAFTMESGRGPHDHGLPGLAEGEGTLMGRKPGRAAK